MALKAAEVYRTKVRAGATGAPTVPAGFVALEQLIRSDCERTEAHPTDLQSRRRMAASKTPFFRNRPGPGKASPGSYTRVGSLGDRPCFFRFEPSGVCADETQAVHDQARNRTGAV